MLNALLRRVARRCETHDRASYAVTSRLERQLGMAPSQPPDSLVEQLADPDLIDCANTWCPRGR